MKYAFFDENIVVLYANRLELGTDETGKKAFAGFYNRTIMNYKRIANQYRMPTQFGQRDTTRQSQYDLLWMIFAEESCMSSFLDMPYAVIENMSPDEIVEAAVKSVMDKVNADADRTIRIVSRRKDDDCNNTDEEDTDTLYFEPDIITELQNNQTMDFLRAHLNYGIYMTDIWQENKEIVRVAKDELLDGELEAELVKIGCYLVRFATRVYINDRDRGIHSRERCPVVGEQLITVKEQLKSSESFMFHPFMSNSILRKCEVFREISAKHISECVNNDIEFHFICMIPKIMYGMSTYSLGTVATIKQKAADDDASAKLFVQEVYVGSSFSSETWYIYNVSSDQIKATKHRQKRKDML